MGSHQFIIAALVVAALVAVIEGQCPKGCWQCTNAVNSVDCEASGSWQICSQPDAVCEVETITYNTGSVSYVGLQYTSYSSRCQSKRACGSRKYYMPAKVSPRAPERERKRSGGRVRVAPKPTKQRYITERCVRCEPAECQKIILNVTCDDMVKVYIDGELIVANNNWQHVNSVEIPRHTKVVAIECRDRAKVRVGIIASLSTGVVTDKTWMCSASHQVGWTKAPFTPNASWQPATTLVTWGWGTVVNSAGISTSAKWIWTDKNTYPGWDTPVYCRKEL